MARIENRTNKRDGKILQAMILNSTVLGRIASRWDGHLFASAWSNLIASWCVEHYQKYQQPPGKCIQDYFDDWSDDGQKDETTVKLVERFLQFLSDDYERQVKDINPEQRLDLANEHFDFLKTRKTLDDAKAELEAGRLQKAQEKIAGYSKISLNSSSGVDFFIDQQEVFSIFDHQLHTIVDYSKDAKLKDLDLFFGGRLERDALVSFMAPEKTGKTWWLIELAWQAMLLRKRVAFFEVGDMSKRQIGERFLVRAAQAPIYSPTGQWPYVVEYPVALRLDQVGGTRQPVVEYEQRVFKQPLDRHKAWAACEKVMQTKVKSKKSFFRLSVHPNSTINVLGIRSIIQDWQLKDWEPDVVIIDYADILADAPGKRDVRDNINMNWKHLRSLSQEFHVLVVTATQSDADSYERRTLDRRNFSEDKRKLAHVTGMVGINVTGEEKDRGLMRLNWIVKREGSYSTSRCLHLASCLPLANPAVLSTW